MSCLFIHAEYSPHSPPRRLRLDVPKGYEKKKLLVAFSKRFVAGDEEVRSFHDSFDELGSVEMRNSGCELFDV